MSEEIRLHKFKVKSGYRRQKMSEKFLQWWDKRITQLAIGLPDAQWKYRDKQIAQHIRKLIENRSEVIECSGCRCDLDMGDAAFCKNCIEKAEKTIGILGQDINTLRKIIDDLEAKNE